MLNPNFKTQNDTITVLYLKFELPYHCGNTHQFKLIHNMYINNNTIRRMCKLRKMLNDDRLSSLKFIIETSLEQYSTIKKLVIPYIQVQPNIRHEIFVGFSMRFKNYGE